MAKKKRTKRQTTTYKTYTYIKEKTERLTPLKTWSEHRCSRSVGSSYSTTCTLCVAPGTNPVISHASGKDREVLISGTHPYAFVTYSIAVNQVIKVSKWWLNQSTKIKMTALLFLFIDVYPYFVNSQAATKHVYKERQICHHQFIYNIDIGYCRWKNGIRSWSVSQLVQKCYFVYCIYSAILKRPTQLPNLTEKSRTELCLNFFFYYGGG